MNITIETDSYSGFCHGVIRAINLAEDNLHHSDKLYSLGAIVHNNAELERLNKIGLAVINKEQMSVLHGADVLIRAHGEPPETYELAKTNNINLIDCTCPVVLKLQKDIKASYLKGNQIVIFGKDGHAEVNGLIGQVNGDAVVVDLKDGEVKGINSIDFSSTSKPIAIFSQTTKDPKEYAFVCSQISNKILKVHTNNNKANATEYLKTKLIVNNTICKQVAQRHSKLLEFAKNHSVILFISGAESSNGKVLYELCKNANKRSYHIESYKDICLEWFKDGDKIGLCGATSTPKWQLDKVADYLKVTLINNHDI